MKIKYINKSYSPLKKPKEITINKNLQYTDECIMGDLNKLTIKNIACTQNTFVHVFWSPPSLKQNFDWDVFGQYEITLAMSAMSLACLKAHNQKVILVTDTMGSKLLQNLPYDDVLILLDNYPVPKNFWAAGKIAALEHLPSDYILIDNDLFIYDGSLIDFINKNQSVCCVIETNTINWMKFGQGILRIPWLSNANPNFTAQTSILKIDNAFLKNLYISTYKEIVKLFTTENGDLIDGLTDGITPDFIAEQFNFKCLCNPTPVSKGYFGPYIEGLCHLLSRAKYIRLPLVLEKLQKLFPEYYDIVIDKWKELDFEIIVE